VQRRIFIGEKSLVVYAHKRFLPVQALALRANLYGRALLFSLGLQIGVDVNSAPEEFKHLSASTEIGPGLPLYSQVKAINLQFGAHYFKASMRSSRIDF
jgi:hypothetical protein